MKYNYNDEMEAFVREDGLGKKIWVNVVEAQRIITLADLGYSVGEIRSKILFNNNRRVSESTVESFLKNVRNGNIVIPEDVIMPITEDLSIEARIDRLESDVEYFKTRYLEKPCGCSKESDESLFDKIRGIFR